jgi:hypothetical protein
VRIPTAAQRHLSDAPRHDRWTVPAQFNQGLATMTSHFNTSPWRRHGRALVNAIAVVVLLGVPARAADQVPGPTGQEILIKTSLLTLNDAIVTGNFTVLHATLAKAFRAEIDPNRLKQAFKSFADQKIDMAAIAAAPPIATADARIDDRGALLLRGRFDVGRRRVVYALDFLPSEGDWKPINLNISVKPTDTTGM